MNLDYYQNLLEYLETDKFSLDLTDFEKQTLIKQSRFYEIRNRILYKKNQKNRDRPIRVIRWTEVEPILYIMHKVLTAGYLGIDAMYYKIADLYYWDQIYKDIRNYVQACEVCQKWAKIKRKEPLYPIQVGWAFKRIRIDLVGPLLITKQNNHYIIVATNYLTR